MLDRFLFSKVDNSQLVVFRVLFGILIACESYGALLTGWVKETLIDPQFTFTFIGFEWLQPLPGNGMYIYFFAMGTLGIFIALGYRYRLSIISFTLLWTTVYLMQKSAYNNHYYLLALISFLMCFLPAHRRHSFDAKRNPSMQRDTMFAYVKWVIIFQLFLVYTYASIAKLYADWLDFSFIEILMKGKANYPVIGGLLQQGWVHKIVGVTGIVFDFLIIPALLWKPTRKIAFIAALFFHLFNSLVFQIGIFPYLALAFTVFFFEPATIRKTFLKKKATLDNHMPVRAPHKKLVLILGAVYFLIQLLLPIRHHFIQDDVLWTEEGHRMSWRMMLRSRNGFIQFKIVDKKTAEVTLLKLDAHLSLKQKNKIAAYPDFIWQYAQQLKKEYATNGKEVSVYAQISKVSINGRPYKNFIDPNVDLAHEKWHHIRHNEWILPSDNMTTIVPNN